MSRPEVRKRRPKDSETMVKETPLAPSKAGVRTVTCNEVPEWQQDKPYIVTGYRPAKADYLDVLTSLTFLHNETCNVYTHLIGALLLPLVATALTHNLSDSQYLDVTRTDHVMFGIYFWTAECCLLLSTLYHLLGSHSHEAERFWHHMDLLGIVIVTVGTFVSGIYYAFICDPGLQKLHWAIITISGTATAALIFVPSFRRWRKVRIGAYVALGASSFIPLLHGVQLYGLDYMLRYAGMKWYLLELGFYSVGVGLYAFHVPECFVPGRVDIWGASHQLFHLAILCAMYVHTMALTQGFTASHTLDLCAIQVAL